MLPSLVDLLVVALATNQVVEIWRHSELFRETRFKIQLLKESLVAKERMSLLDHHIYYRFTQLMLCNWCLSVWVGLLVAIAYVSAIVGTGLLDLLIRVPILALAISRAANLINDVLYQFCRTPKYDIAPPLDFHKEREAMMAETNQQNRETDPPDLGTSGLFSETETVQFETVQAVCPYCGSSDITNEGPPNEFQLLEVDCHTCGRKWTEPSSDKPAVTEQMSIQYDDETKTSGTITMPNKSVNINRTQPYDKNSTKPGPGRDGHG